MPDTRASSGAEAVLTSTPTALTQSSTTASSERASSRFADVVLILADADRLRIDLHQLGQRILQPPRDRHRAAQGHVELRQLLGREGRGRIDRSAGLRHDDLRHLQVRQPLHQLGGELVGLARRGAVADRDEIDAVRHRQHRRASPARRPSAAAVHADRSPWWPRPCRWRRRRRPSRRSGSRDRGPW